MVRKQNLRNFLRKEVVKHRIHPPSPPKLTTPGGVLEGCSHLQYGGDSSIISDSDSLFGDPIVVEEAKAEKRLQQFLSQPPIIHLSVQTGSPLFPVNPTLQSLKDELKYLVYRINDANPREKDLIQRQRTALVEEIARLEEEASTDGAKQHKARYEEQFKIVPEPISKWEKQLFRCRLKLDKARQGQEKSLKRKRVEEDIGDLDGEDQFRLGINKKPPVTKVSGHWQSTIHDYLPGFENKSESSGSRNIMSLRQVSVEDRVLLRRELMELGKKLAEEERKALKPTF